MERVIEEYIYNVEWAPNNYEYDFFVDMEIHFEKVVKVGYEDRYSAQFIISNRADAQYSDRRWDFTLEPGFTLTHTNQFDSFRSYIDYYIHMMHGYEFDKVKKFGGNNYFDDALQVCQLARFSSRYFNGWDQREEWVEEYTEDGNSHFRYLNFLYYTGEWLYYEERDFDMAKKYLLYAVKQFEEIPEDKRQRFFDLNYYKYAEALADYKEYSAISKMAALDPAHNDIYQGYLKKR